MSMRESSKKAAKKLQGPGCFWPPSLLGVLVFVMIPFGDALRTLIFDSRGIDFVGLGRLSGVLANQAFPPGGCEYRAVYGGQRCRF